MRYALLIFALSCAQTDQLPTEQFLDGQTECTDTQDCIAKMNQPIYTCQDDKECVAIKADCCGCNYGGKQMAVHKNIASIILEKLARVCKNVYCTAVISNDPSCKQVPKCINHNCTMAAS